MSQVFSSICVKTFGESDNEAINREKMEIVHKISTQSVDSDKEVVLSGGLDFGRMQKTRSVLFMHDPYTIIGKMLWVKADPIAGCVRAKTQFANTEMAREAFGLCADGFMKGWSIGMDWSSIKYCDDDEHEKLVRENPTFAGARRIIKTAKVMEYSAVSLPANEDALTEALRSGRAGKLKAAFEKLLDDARKTSSVNVVEPIGRLEPPRIAALPITGGYVVRRIQEVLRESGT